MKLTCLNCDYRFDSSQAKIPAKCPYCDKEGTIEAAKEMQDLIDEVSAELDEKEARPT